MSSSGVKIPVFAGFGMGTTAKRVGIGITWIRICYVLELAPLSLTLLLKSDPSPTDHRYLKAHITQHWNQELLGINGIGIGIMKFKKKILKIRIRSQIRHRNYNTSNVFIRQEELGGFVRG